TLAGEHSDAPDNVGQERNWSTMLHPYLWAKSPRFVDLNPDEPRWHPLVCHLIDVAMVALAIWEDLLPPVVKDQVCESLGMTSRQAAGRWIAYFVGLHDIGKA